MEKEYTFHQSSFYIQMHLPMSGFSTADEIGKFTQLEYISQIATTIVAFEHFNERNSRYVDMLADDDVMRCPYNVTYRLFDSEVSAAIAVQNFLSSTSSVVLDKYPDYVIGEIRSIVTGPLAIAAGVNNVPQITFRSTAPNLSDIETYPMLSRTAVPDDVAAKSMVKILSNYNFNVVGMIYVGGNYGAPYKEAIFAECQNYNIRLHSASYTTKNAQSIQSALKEIGDLGINIFIAALSGDDFSMFMAEAVKLNLFGYPKLWIFTDSVRKVHIRMANNPAYYRALEGSLQIAAVASIATDPVSSLFRSEWKSFGKYREKINQYLPGGSLYGGDMIASTDIGKSHFYNFTYQLSEDFFNKTEFTDYLPSAYDAAIAACVAACKTGLQFPVTPSSKKKDMFTMINTLRFHGTSGQVQFTVQGDRYNGNIRLLNFKYNMETIPKRDYFVDAGGWDQQNNLWSINKAVLLFPGNFTNPPPYVTPPELDDHSLELSELGAGYFFLISALASCFFFLVWTIYFRNSKVVKRSQWEFLVAFLFGNAISASSIAPLMDDKGPSRNVSCMLVPWLYSLGFIITMASLLVKTYRVMKIFNNQQLKKVRITDMQLFGLILIFVALDIFVMTLWTVTDPLVWVVEIKRTDFFGNPVETFGECTTESWGYVVALLMYHLAMLAGGSYVSFQARKIPSSFQESKWINISMMSYLQIFAVGVPAIAAVYTIPQSRFLMMSIVIWFSIMVRLFAIFIPKMLALHQYGDLDENSAPKPEKKPQQHGSIPNLRSPDPVRLEGQVRSSSLKHETIDDVEHGPAKKPHLDNHEKLDSNVQQHNNNYNKSIERIQEKSENILGGLSDPFAGFHMPSISLGELQDIQRKSGAVALTTDDECKGYEVSSSVDLNPNGSESEHLNIKRRDNGNSNKKDNLHRYLEESDDIKSFNFKKSYLFTPDQRLLSSTDESKETTSESKRPTTSVTIS